jgi:hypothetical protein
MDSYSWRSDGDMNFSMAQSSQQENIDSEEEVIEILQEGMVNPSQDVENLTNQAATRAPNWSWSQKYRFIQLIAQCGHGKWMAVAEKLEEECKIPVVAKQRSDGSYLRRCFNTLAGNTSLLRKPFKPKKAPPTRGKSRSEAAKIIASHVAIEEDRRKQFEHAQKLMSDIRGKPIDVNFDSH